MLFTLAILAWQDPQPSAILSLVGAQRDDDYASDMQFTPDGRRLIVHHRIASGQSSLTEIDVAQGQVVARAPEFQRCSGIALSPSGRIALAPERSSGRLRILSIPGLQLTATVDLSPFTANDSFRPAADSTGTRAVLMDDAGDRIWVVDLATATQERLITLVSPQFVPKVQIGADDLSMPFRDGQFVFTIDISTGLESARRSISAPGNPGSPVLSGDGSVAAVLTVDPANGTKYVERFAIPGLASLGWVTLNGTVSEHGLLLDGDGDRGLVADGTTSLVANLVTGALTGPIPASLSRRFDSTGSRVVASTGPDLVVADAVTGTLLGRFQPRGRDSNVDRIELSPNGRFAAVGRQASERVEVFEITPNVPFRRGDVSSGFGVEADGPYNIVASADGRRAAVIARDSDDLRVIDIDGPPALLGRVALDRGPEHAARRADGRVLVVHGRGASLSVVDIDVPAEVARYSLPDAAYFVQPELQGGAAWVLLDGATSRSLVRLDTVSGAVLATIQLPGGAGVTSVGRELLATIQFDLPRAHAFVASADTSQLSLIDLASATVVANATIQSVMEPGALAVSGDGTRVFHRGSLVNARAFAVSPQGLAQLWSWTCGIPTPHPETPVSITLYDHDRYLLCNGGCTGTAAIVSTSSGSVVFGGTPSFSSSVQSLRAFDNEVWVDTADSPIFRFRANPGAGALGFAGNEGDPECCSEMISVPSTGLTIGMADENGQQSGPLDDHFFVLDLVQDTPICSPSVPNSTGVVASLRIDGSGLARSPLVATVEGLQPGGMVGYLLAATSAASPTPLGFGVGELCLGGPIARLSNQAQAADSMGRQRFVVEAESFQIGGLPIYVQPGSTWAFQAWHRDTTSSGAATSNTSTARMVRFD